MMTEEKEKRSGQELSPAIPNRRALESYLRFSYPPGEGGTMDGKPADYPEIRFAFEPEREKAEYLAELSALLDEMLEEERRCSDAAFLSSGVDSSLIAFGIGAKKTFSVAYEEEEFDESALALQASKRLGSEHHTLRLGPVEYFDALDEALAFRGAPTGDASYVALFLAAREAARFTDTVCSGEGPDELFCGYPCYSRYFDAPREDFWLDVNTILNLGEAPKLPRCGGDGFLKMNAFDLTYWMRGNILPNVSAAAKGAGISIRTPYLRQELWDFALALPTKYKANRHMGKLLFREAAERILGPEIAFREKRGFPVPVRKWMRREPYRTIILDELTGSSARELLRCADVDGLLRDFYLDGDDSRWKPLWEMFTLMRWLDTKPLN